MLLSLSINVKKIYLKSNLIIENQYFPMFNWFKYSLLKTNIILLSCERYQKMTFRNRCIVAGSKGIINLSVPIAGGRVQRTPYKDVRICNLEKWQLNHWRTITSCYNRSPYFEYYRDGLEPFFVKRCDFLFDHNLSILYWLKQILGFPPGFVITDQLNGQSSNGEIIEDIRNKWLPKNFQAERAGFVYPQVFEDRIGFQPNLSILDLLFNAGPETMNILKQGLE